MCSVRVKNENGALPLVTGKGTAGAEPNAGSGMNGGDSSAGAAIALADVYSSLEAAGYDLNPVVKGQYESWVATELTSDYAIANATADSFETVAATASWKTSLATYDDAALVVLSAGSGAIGENGRVHRLQLDAEQYKLIDYAAANFDKVIVVLNTGTTMEMADIQQDEGIDAVLWMGFPGSTGVMALGQILVGEDADGNEISPSGHTTDTWVADFTKDPTWYNTGVYGSEFGNRYLYDGNTTDYAFVNYEEGIYVGYRYWETRGYEEKQADPDSTWYEDNVVYPFGYGLSYTTFSWEVTFEKADGSQIGADDVIEVSVKVTNTGEHAGKDVVQLYYTAPYYEGGIEKAHVVLGDFVKTKLLAAGESETCQPVPRSGGARGYRRCGRCGNTDQPRQKRGVPAKLFAVSECRLKAVLQIRTDARRRAEVFRAAPFCAPVRHLVEQIVLCGRFFCKKRLRSGQGY